MAFDGHLLHLSSGALPCCPRRLPFLHQEQREWLQTFEWQGLGPLTPRSVLFCVRASQPSATHPSLLGSVSEWQGHCSAVAALSRPHIVILTQMTSQCAYLSLNFLSSCWKHPTPGPFLQDVIPPPSTQHIQNGTQQLFSNTFPLFTYPILSALLLRFPSPSLRPPCRFWNLLSVTCSMEHQSLVHPLLPSCSCPALVPWAHISNSLPVSLCLSSTLAASQCSLHCWVNLPKVALTTSLSTPMSQHCPWPF